LGVTNYNGHDFANKSNHKHGKPSLVQDVLDTVKHDPKVLQIAPQLHSSNEPHSSPNPLDKHLENEDLLIKNLA
jgi:hypothetical protein